MNESTKYLNSNYNGANPQLTALKIKLKKLTIELEAKKKELEKFY